MMKILIVDDDRGIREMITEIIREYFPEAIVVMGITGRDGWREFQESCPDLVVTDLRMETPDAGLWLAEKIKVASLQATPVIMFAGTKPDQMDNIDFFVAKLTSVRGLSEAIKSAYELKTKIRTGGN